MRIAILTPPKPKAGRADIDNTFEQAEEIDAALHKLGHDTVAVTWLGAGDRTRKAIAKARPDIVFNLVEDIPEGAGKIHLVTALLDTLRLPYTGTHTEALEALGDKPRMKATLVEGGLPVAPNLGEGDAGARYIVKSRTDHSSLGLSAANVVTGRVMAEALIAEKKKAEGGEWFAEAYIDGREFNVAILETVLGPSVLPPSEILFLDHAGRPKVLGFDEKWNEASPTFDKTPRTFPDDPADAPLLAELQRLALASWRIFALTGCARVDFRVDPTGRPFILEVNANPCLSAEAGFCAAAAEAGMSQTDVVSHLLAAAQN